MTPAPSASRRATFRTAYPSPHSPPLALQPSKPASSVISPPRLRSHTISAPGMPVCRADFTASHPSVAAAQAAHDDRAHHSHATSPLLALDAEHGLDPLALLGIPAHAAATASSHATASAAAPAPSAPGPVGASTSAALHPVTPRPLRPMSLQPFMGGVWDTPVGGSPPHAHHAAMGLSAAATAATALGAAAAPVAAGWGFGSPPVRASAGASPAPADRFYSPFQAGLELTHGLFDGLKGLGDGMGLPGPGLSQPSLRASQLPDPLLYAPSVAPLAAATTLPFWTPSRYDSLQPPAALAPAAPVGAVHAATSLAIEPSYGYLMDHAAVSAAAAPASSAAAPSSSGLPSSTISPWAVTDAYGGMALGSALSNPWASDTATAPMLPSVTHAYAHPTSTSSAGLNGPSRSMAHARRHPGTSDGSKNGTNHGASIHVNGQSQSQSHGQSHGHGYDRHSSSSSSSHGHSAALDLAAPRGTPKSMADASRRSAPHAHPHAAAKPAAKGMNGMHRSRAHSSAAAQLLHLPLHPSQRPARPARPPAATPFGLAPAFSPPPSASSPSASAIVHAMPGPASATPGGHASGRRGAPRGARHGSPARLPPASASPSREAEQVAAA
ncbi:hypothetical protein CXG81DRAFT_28413 [Caulochytrium protostelioides]|uniref:Uncharacterized protein n=1 Tax=Caulochytrium protostelioides TaxID=1555241 RepID=A0A4P9WZ72_9FUNG|nr:hypothetical protein CXG81DRAFT_28413 [Caulochytrium protostelioides]|eukprot:RKO98794.1 hypothetical protein CXG81DRAFT_28413 [Caulochytrium protostelioides]